MYDNSREKDRELLEIYKLYVNTAIKNTDVRMKMHAFFVSLNAFIISASKFVQSPLNLVVFCVIINALWWLLTKSNAQLNEAKFKEIHEMEESLCCKPFRREEDEYKKDRRINFTTIEQGIPLVFIMFLLFTLFLP